MRIEPHGLPHNVGAFGTRAGQQPHFVHGVEQLAVRGLQTVDLGNRARDNHTHHIGHIVFLNGFGDGLIHNRRVLNDPFLFFLFRHAVRHPF